MKKRGAKAKPADSGPTTKSPSRKNSREPPPAATVLLKKLKSEAEFGNGTSMGLHFQLRRLDGNARGD